MWWWLVVLVLGGASALFGSLHAASSTDLKRLLAYSTTDNIGLVLLAVGAAGLFDATRHPLLAALSLVSALVLLFNHAGFKGALFLSAGSVQVATGSRDLDRLGGLLRRMPQTGALFLVAAAAISALPPLNGFIGEWLLFQSLLHGAAIGSTAGDIAIPLAVAALALTAGLTVVAFVKAVGIGFLGRPRSESADDATEVPGTMRLAVGLLVAVCVVLGVVPTLDLPGRRASGEDGLAGAPHPGPGAWRRPAGGRAPRDAGPRRAGRCPGGGRGRRHGSSPGVVAPAHAPRGRGLGLWSPAPDRPHAVHGHVVCRARAAGLRRRASACPRPGRHPRGRVALRHRVGDVRQHGGRRHRAGSLHTRHPGRPTLGTGGPATPTRERPPLPGLRVGCPRHRAGGAWR